MVAGIILTVDQEELELWLEISVCPLILLSVFTVLNDRTEKLASFLPPLQLQAAVNPIQLGGDKFRVKIYEKIIITTATFYNF